MKKIIYAIIFSLTLNLTVHAQQKILFDNTKSEEAGNADWVIDHTEPIPSPAQSGISSSTSETFWDGAISAWGVEMVQRGFTVETLPSYHDISYGNSSNSQDLSNYDVYVICEPNNQFSSSEKTAIMNFVKNGGGLFMISDHESADRDGDGWTAYTAFNDLINSNSVDNNKAFGMLFTNPDFINDYPNYNKISDSNDPLLNGDAGFVNAMEFHGSASMTVYPNNNSTVKPVFFRTGYSTSGTTEVMVAYSRYGQGKVVGLVDSSPADDGSGASGNNLYDGWNEHDNGILITNATLWLADKSNAIEEIKQNSINIYPNPGKKFINIYSKTQIKQIKISNILGKELLRKNILSNNTVVDIDFLNKGIYLIETETNEGTFLSKVIKE